MPLVSAINRLWTLTLQQGRCESIILTNPALNALGRKQLREELRYRLDGQWARRAAMVVLRELGVEPLQGIKMAKMAKIRRHSFATGL